MSQSDGSNRAFGAGRLRSRRRLVQRAALSCAVALGMWGTGATASAQSDEEARAKELIATIQKEMAEIDKALTDAESSSPAAAGAKIKATVQNIEELLRQVQENQASVVRNIEELVKMTKYQQSNQSKGGGGEKKGDSESQPQNKERDKDKEPGDLQQQGDPKEGEKPENQGQDKPENGGADDQKPKDSEGQKPPGETEPFQREDIGGRWGFLPPKVSEAFLNLSDDEFPEKYRRLLEKYYKRENNKASKDG